MIEVPEPPHLPHPPAEAAGGKASGHGWLDRITTGLLLLISLCSLYVAWHTSHTMEGLVRENARLVRAQSTPLLDYGTGNAIDQTRTMAALVINVGNGPARVRWSRFQLDGRTYATWPELAAAVAPAAGTADGLVTASLDGTLLRAGAERRLINWVAPAPGPEAEAWQKIDSVRGRVRADICYCSLFDECWLATFDGGVSSLAEQCPDPPPAGR
jgi:hypothetical protein